MRKKITKSKGLIGRLYDSAKPSEQLMFRAELLKAQEQYGTDYAKRFRDHYQYCENPYEVLSIYLDLARKYLGYVDGQPMPTDSMLETLQMEQAA
ncbi:hypothetical protein [Spirosoma aerolatum]|uniref:hypothetical protein n=1 Tax=Spirosoma aerolatum TaxID=1211326 RepID=UPI0009AC7D44|nr:hypothetical protein [Spirosoma aerolatum]